jgi:prophage antirepressor-like protein
LDELRPRLGEGAFLPHNWQPHTVLISEGGLYRLLCRSTKPEAIKFEMWVFDDVLPTLRETGTYTIETQLQLLTERVQQLEILNVKLQERVAVMTKTNETKHVFQLYKHRPIPNKYLFIGTQSKYLQRAKKAVNSERYDIILKDVNVPNSMNILNRL